MTVEIDYKLYSKGMTKIISKQFETRFEQRLFEEELESEEIVFSIVEKRRVLPWQN